MRLQYNPNTTPTLHAAFRVWQVLDAAPLSSQIVGQMGLLGGQDGHRRRMEALRLRLSASSLFMRSCAPFLLIAPYWDLVSVLGYDLLNLLSRRSLTRRRLLLTRS